MIRQPFAAIGTVVRAAIILGVLTGDAGAQGPTVFYACYVPETGTVYRIKEPNTPLACGVSVPKGKSGGIPQPHVEFSWTDGAGATSDHGALAGLTDDDHSQYLLTDGVRNSTGFAVSGSLGVGSIPATGAGVRMMWYPGKAAFRAVEITGAAAAIGSDAYIGQGSVGMGQNVVASGAQSVALGDGAFATGAGSVGLGKGVASGDLAVAAVTGHAYGGYAVAMGYNVNASGDQSMALGSYANTNLRRGAFVWGDASTPIVVDAVADNQFVARAARFWFGNNNNVTAPPGHLIETSTGAFLSTGGAWTNSSDSARKTGFTDVDGEQVLAKLAAMPVTTWSYRDEDSTVRHMGPTAQDFATAFALGSSDKAIATIDADGVSLAAIKALVSRTAALQERESKIAALQERVSHLEAMLERLTAGLGVARK